MVAVPLMLVTEAPAAPTVTVAIWRGGVMTSAVCVPVPVTVAEPLTSWTKTAVLTVLGEGDGAGGGSVSSPGADQGVLVSV